MELVKCDHCEDTQYAGSPVLKTWVSIYRLPLPDEIVAEMEEAWRDGQIDPIYERPHHFCSLAHLGEWIKENVAFIP